VRVRKRKIARFLLVRTKINVYRHVGGAPNVAVRYLEPLREFGVEDDGGGLEVFISPEDDLRAGRALQALPDNGAPRMAVAPSARHPNKIWPADRFAAAASEVARRHGSGIVLLGSTAERERCGAVEQMVRERAPSASVANLAGELSLTETAGVLDRCAVVLTNDSGLMHLAAARRRPVIAVFGPTVREFGFFPFRTPSTVLEHAGLHCRPCTHIGLPDCPLGHFRCMNEIPAEAAVEAAERFLQAA
jgi:heptosyltransferase-2